MPALTICPPLKLQVLVTDETTGLLVPLVGGKVYTYKATTLDLADTYTDYLQTSLNTNPILLDARGEANVFLLPIAYDFLVNDTNDVFVLQQFGILGGSAAGSLTFVRTLDELKALPAGSASYVIVAGYHTFNDQCNSSWIYDKDSTKVSDDVFVTEPNGIGPDPGRYLKEDAGELISPKYAGIVPGTAAQDYGVLDAALTNSFPNGASVHFPAGEWIIDEDTTLFSAQSSVSCEVGTQFNISTGKTLTITGSFYAPINAADLPLFTGSGSVVFAIGRQITGYPEWFGAGIGDSTTSLNKMLASGLNTFQLNNTYNIADTLAFPSNPQPVTIHGESGAFSLTSATILNLGTSCNFYNVSVFCNAFPFIVNQSSGNSVWTGGTIQGTVDASTFLLNLLGSTVSQLTFDGVYLQGRNIGGPGAANGLVKASSGINNFSNNTFYQIDSLDYGLISDQAGTVINITNDNVPVAFAVAYTSDTNSGIINVGVKSINGVVTIPDDLAIGGNVVGDLRAENNIKAGVTGAGLLFERPGSASTFLIPGIASMFTIVDDAAFGSGTYKSTAATLTTLMSFTVPGNSLINTGDSIIFTGFGQVGADVTKNYAFKINLGTIGIYAPIQDSGDTTSGLSAIFGIGYLASWNFRATFSLIGTKVRWCFESPFVLGGGQDIITKYAVGVDTLNMAVDQAFSVQVKMNTAGSFTASGMQQDYLQVTYQPALV